MNTRAMLHIPAPRLLPMAILAMGVLLATKAAELGGFGPTRLAPAAVGGAASLVQTGLVASAQAAGPAPASPAAMNPGAGRSRPPELPAGTVQSAAAGQAGPQAGPQAGSQPAQGGAPPTVVTTIDPNAPPPVSAAERQLLEDLRARRLTLEAREQEIAGREALLAAAERRLQQRVDEIAAMQARMEQLDRAAREREEANWNNLVRIYENMRPRDAARIFDELEMPVLIEVVARMKQRAVAPILAGMQADRAQRVTAELAARQARGGQGG